MTSNLVENISLMSWPKSARVDAAINVMDRIRDHRNTILINLLDRQALKEYLFFHFRVKNVSEGRMEEISKMLMGLILSPLDLNFYCRLIKKINNESNPVFSDEDELYFHQEIETLLQEYLD